MLTEQTDGLPSLQNPFMAGILALREKSTLSSPVPLFLHIPATGDLRVPKNSTPLFHLRDPCIFCYNAIVRQIF
jgi:hypothetical protein